MKLVLSFCIFLFMGLGLQAQKYAYIDSKYILSKIPEYKEAQDELDKLSEKWQKEIDDKIADNEKNIRAFEEEKILLDDAMIEKRQKEIDEATAEIRELQIKRFGVNGELFKKRQELIKPIQDKLYKAVQEVAKARYDFVFDKAVNSNIMYANPRNDISDKVLQQMGYN